MDKSEAVKKLDRQRQALLNVQATGVQDAAFKKWLRDTELAIEFVFGKSTRHLSDFESVSWTPGSYDGFNPDPEWRAAFIEGRREADGLLQSMIEEINEYWGAKSDSQANRTNRRSPRSCHGRSSLFTVERSHFVKASRDSWKKLKLKPIILHEQPNKGRTIIESLSTTLTCRSQSFFSRRMTGADFWTPRWRSNRNPSEAKCHS